LKQELQIVLSESDYWVGANNQSFAKKKRRRRRKRKNLLKSQVL